MTMLNLQRLSRARREGSRAPWERRWRSWAFAALSSVLAFAPSTARAQSQQAPSPAPAPAVALPALPQQQEQEQPAELQQYLLQLDSNLFTIRDQARRNFQTWAARHPRRSQLAAELRAELANPRWSLEARGVVEGVLAGLPAVDTPLPVPSAKEMDQAVASLNHADAGAREAAAWQLEQWTRLEPPGICLVVEQYRKHLAGDALSFDARRKLEQRYQWARRRWVLSDPARWVTSPASDEQLNTWIRTLSQDETERNRQAIRTARRELLDQMVQDDRAQPIGALLDQRREDPALSRQAAERLYELAEWCRPSLVAEVWSDGTLTTIQFLQVGVPQHPFGAPRITLFDQVNDKQARCVSGNSLEPGIYPVGEAIPHPTSPGPLFHITNATTPRQQMAYRYRALVQTEAERFQQLTARTLANWTESRARLNERQILLLNTMDWEVISEKIGAYFLAVDDVRLEAGEGFFPDDTRQFAKICLVLANRGARSAIPGLQQAIAKNRFLPPKAGEERLEWVALLAIAARDAGEGFDAWLLEQAASQQKLSAYSLDAAEDWDATLGACAAGLFLKRRGLEPEEHGLQSLVFRREVNNVPWYRFRKPDDRERFLRTWVKPAEPRIPATPERGPARPAVP